MRSGGTVFDLLLHWLALSIQPGSPRGCTAFCCGGVGGLCSFCFGFVDTRVGVNGRCICSFLMSDECFAFLRDCCKVFASTKLSRNIPRSRSFA